MNHFQKTKTRWNNNKHLNYQDEITKDHWHRKKIYKSEYPNSCLERQLNQNNSGKRVKKKSERGRKRKKKITSIPFPPPAPGNSSPETKSRHHPPFPPYLYTKFDHQRTKQYTGMITIATRRRRSSILREKKDRTPPISSARERGACAIQTPDEVA